MGLFFSRNIANYIISSFSVSEKTRGKLSQMQFGNMVSLVSRTGRHLQRYDKGCREVVGCIPYRYRNSKQCSSVEELEVLVISSQKGQAMMFPKGGWEIDESMEEAASRETLEEAGVVGKVECKLGTWRYKSNSQGKVHVGYIIPLLVKEQLDFWPEKNIRKRRWITVAEAKQVCKHGWMIEALDVLVRRQTSTHLQQVEEKVDTICT
jgi:diphosphoinositol-polyphosphate diphosphatase